MSLVSQALELTKLVKHGQTYVQIQWFCVGWERSKTAWVGDAGTDPEFLMLLEPRELVGRRAWHFAPIRMTDHELFGHQDNHLI